MNMRRPTKIVVGLAAAGVLAGSVVAGVSLAAGKRANEEQTVTIALDWVPNTNHTGIYVADKLGYFKQQGLKLKIIPYSGTNTDVLVNSGKADLGFSFVPQLLFSRTAGLKIKGVGAVMGRNTEALVVLKDSRFKRPRDFAQGTTYGGFGLPYEVPTWSAVIRADGGKPNFKSAVLNTAAYEALYKKKIDWSALFMGWEAIEAKLRNPPVQLRTFPLTRYLGEAGNYPSVILVASDSEIAGKKDLLKKALAAISKGYTFAAKNPKQAADILTSYDSALQKNPKLVQESAKYLAPVYTANGRWGVIKPVQISGLGQILLKAGVLKGPDGKPVTSINYGDLWTQSLLPSS